MRIRLLVIALGFYLIFGLPAGAQPAPPERWYTIETEHFRIIYHAGTEGLAQEAAVTAEDAYKRWQEELKSAPPGKTNLVVIDIDDSPNGFADTFDQTVWAFTAQAQFSSFFGNQPSNMGSTVVHEYWHVLDIDKVGGPSRTLRNLFGRIIMPNGTKPGFSTEGTATYSELLYYGYSRASWPLSAMYLRQMVLDNKFPTLDRAGTFYSTTDWPGRGVLWYLFGSWFMRYIEESYGRGSLEKIDSITANDWLASLSDLLANILYDNYGVAIFLSPDFGQTLQKALSVPVDELYAGYRKWLRDQFTERVAQIQSEGITASRKLTSLGYSTYQPAWSPDGKWVAYEHGSSFRTGGVRLTTASGEQDHPLFAAPFIFDAAFSWSPDSDQLVYSKYDVYRTYYSFNDLYIYDLKQRRERRLTWGQRAFSPVFSRDGKSVLFLRQRKGDLNHDLAQLDLASGAVTQVKEFPAGTYVDALALSPDGQTLALSVWKRPGYSDLYTMPAAGGELTPLTQDKAEDFRPAWAPDGQHILFDSFRDGMVNIYALRVSDGSMYKVTNTVSAAFDPDVSPDGKQLAFVGYSSSGFDIHVMELDPNRWKPYNATKESIPDWEGYPKTDYPIGRYNPVPTLAPKYWLPKLFGDPLGLMGPPSISEIGLATGAVDALYQRSYDLSLGYSLENKRLLYSFDYSDAALLSPMELSFSTGQDAWGAWQSLSASYPLIEQFNHSQSLTVSATEADYGGVTRSLSAAWSMFHRSAFDLWRKDIRLTISGDLTHLVSENKLERQVIVDLRETVRLPVIDAQGAHLLMIKGTYGWSDVQRAFRLGGERGRFLLRGFGRGVQRGSQIASGSVEYRFPLWAIERGLKLFPLFIDDLRGALFIDSGTADAALKLNGVKLGIGAELHLSLVTGYGSSGSIRLGVAQGLGEREPKTYLLLGLAF